MKLRNDLVASAFVMNETSDKFLLLHHRKLGKWLPPGGHVDDGEMPHEAALRETLEETGITAELMLTPGDMKSGITSIPQIPLPFCILHEDIPGWKNDPAHMHVDLIYLARISSKSGKLNNNEKESKESGWFSADEIEGLDTFENVRETVREIIRMLNMDV